MEKIAILAIVAVFGAAGAVARYGVSYWVMQATGSSFPYGTLAVNLIGCLLLGFVAHVGQNTELIHPWLQAGVTIGTLGAFTTFSTFSYETIRQLEEGQWRDGFVNVAASLACGLFAVWLGIRLAQQIYGGS